MSFGLHLGWAIEGAVGSEFKIDASYLSPNVSIALRLEHATRMYDVSFIASETVVKLVSKDIAAKCRLIDKVKFKGLEKWSLELYVIDLDSAALEAKEHRPIVWSLRQRFKARQLLEAEKRRKWSDDYCVAGQFEHQDILAMRKRYTVDFLQIFNMGYHNYSQGEWQVARRLLTTTLTMVGFKDGPSSYLLAYMETPYQFEAPEWWRGVHTVL